MNNKQDVLDFAIKLLTERYMTSVYCEPLSVPDTLEEFFYNVHGIKLDEAKKLAEEFGDTIKIGNRGVAEEIKSTKLAYEYKRAEVKEFMNIKVAVETKDAKQAWVILSERNYSDYEYENFSIEHIENL